MTAPEATATCNVRANLAEREALAIQLRRVTAQLMLLSKKDWRRRGLIEQQVALQERLAQLRMERQAAAAHEPDRTCGYAKSKRAMIGALLSWRDEMLRSIADPRTTPAERHFSERACKRIALALGVEGGP